MNDAAELFERIMYAQVASCSCLTKTPVHRHHDPLCRYRVLFDCAVALANLKGERDGWRNTARRIVAMLIRRKRAARVRMSEAIRFSKVEFDEAATAANVARRMLTGES